MAKRQQFEAFPKNYILPLALAFLLTASIVFTNGFQDSQDIRSRATDGPYGSPTPTILRTPTPLPQRAVGSIKFPNANSCSDVCKSFYSNTNYIGQCVSVGLNSATNDGDYWGHPAPGALCSWINGSYGCGSTLRSVDPNICAGVKEETNCLCRQVPRIR